MDQVLQLSDHQDNKDIIEKKENGLIVYKAKEYYMLKLISGEIYELTIEEGKRISQMYNDKKSGTKMILLDKDFIPLHQIKIIKYNIKVIYSGIGIK